MIVDFHTHIFPDRIAAPTVAALAASAHIAPHADGTAEGLRASMRASGVTLSVNLPVLTRPTQLDSIADFAEGLNATALSGGGILSFAGVHPAMENVCERLHELHARGFLGIKIHPDYQGTFIDDEAYVRILAEAKALGMITVTHAGLDGAYVGEPIKCTPVRVMRLLDRLGGYDRLVLAHLGGNELYDEVIATLCGEDVYFDTAYTMHELSDGAMLRLIERHGDRRILFATDSPWRDQNEELARVRALGLGDACERRILGENARELLGLA